MRPPSHDGLLLGDIGLAGDIADLGLSPEDIGDDGETREETLSPSVTCIAKRSGETELQLATVAPAIAS